MADNKKQKLTSTRTAKLLVAAALLASGVYLTSIEFLGREWTTRSGCLIAMLGIWSGLGGIVQERILAKNIRRKKRNAIITAQARLVEKNADTDLIQSELDKIKESYDAQFAHAAEKLRISLGVEEVTLVLAGTFIWGFGDLLWI